MANRNFIYVNSDNELEEEALSVSSSAGAGDSGKLATLNASGQWDSSFINDAGIDHGSIGGLGDDDHTQYILVDGTRAFTGDQSMGSNKITSLAPGTAGTDAVNLNQLQAVENGLDWKDSVRFATTAALPTFTGGGTGTLTLTSQTAYSPDGTAVVDGDRILVKDEGASDVDHGIYDVSGVGAEIVLTRSSDADADAEVTANMTVQVEEGTANADSIWRITTNDPITVNTTAIAFGQMVITAYTASLGVELVGSDFRADLLASGGLALTGNELGVNAQDFDGEGLIANTALDLAIDWSTAFNDAKAVKAEDLNSTANGEGASIIGIEDTGGYFTSTDVEGALAELGARETDSVSYTAGTGGVTIGDLVYISANDTVLPLPITGGTSSNYGIGLARTTESAAASVVISANDHVLAGVLTGATAGATYYWDGSAITATKPTASGSTVYIVGYAKNATDLQVEVRLVKRNA